METKNQPLERFELIKLSETFEYDYFGDFVLNNFEDSIGFFKDKQKALEEANRLNSKPSKSINELYIVQEHYKNKFNEDCSRWISK